MTLTDLKPGDRATLYLDTCNPDRPRQPVTVQAISLAIIYAAGRAFQVSNGLCVDEYGLKLSADTEEWK